MRGVREWPRCFAVGWKQFSDPPTCKVSAGLVSFVLGLSLWLVDDHLLPVSSHSALSTCLCPDFLFLQGYHSCWIRAHLNDFILT